MLEQGVEHGGIKPVCQFGDLVQRMLIAAQQLLQRLASDWRSVGAVSQAGVVDRTRNQVVVKRCVVLDVQLLLALLELVQRRQADIDMPALDQFRHLPIEERQQQGSDMRSIHVRIGHQDDAVITQFVGVVFILADTGTERGDQGAHLGRGQHAIETGLLHVEDLALHQLFDSLDAQTSRFATFSAFNSMNSRRGSTASPISMENI